MKIVKMLWFHIRRNCFPISYVFESHNVSKRFQNFLEFKRQIVKFLNTFLEIISELKKRDIRKKTTNFGQFNF
jgi:hypothetical protein